MLATAIGLLLSKLQGLPALSLMTGTNSTDNIESCTSP